jgi:maltose O-acetyltransferase
LIIINNKAGLFSATVATFFRKIYTFSEKLKNYAYYISISGRFRHIGRNVTIDYGVVFGGEQNITIGDNVFIGRNAIINAANGGQILIGDGAAIGANTTIVTWNLDNLNHQSLIRSGNKNIPKDVEIGRGVGIGYNVTINAGVVLNDGCEVSAGSVVVRDVKSYEIVAGVPAVVVGKRNNMGVGYV